MGCNCGGRGSAPTAFSGGAPVVFRLFFPAPGPGMKHGATVDYWDENAANEAAEAIPGAVVKKIDPRTGTEVA